MQLKQLSRNVLYEHSKLLEHFTIYVIQTHMIKVNYITVKWSSYKKQNLECQFFSTFITQMHVLLLLFLPLKSRQWLVKVENLRDLSIYRAYIQ